MNDATFKNPPSSAPAGGERLRLDEGALEAAKRSLEQGAVTPSYGPWREDIIKLARSLGWPEVTEFYEDNDVSANVDRRRPRLEFERLLGDMRGPVSRPGV